MSGTKALRRAADPAGGDITYATAPTTLGTILVARRRDGICALLLGESRQRLERELGAAFPDHERTADEDALLPDLLSAVAIVERPWTAFSSPLSIGGTAFQRRAWSAVREIPPGKTASYAEIAQKIGAPSALRAVAGACAANVLAIAIPCHRVLRSNGALSGYRWGLERKRELLQREKAGAGVGS
jgi:AraC family transcriptional regulator of adaptative response/methylated-DNA-[protein]-cysteine methyltransferase